MGSGTDPCESRDPHYYTTILYGSSNSIKFTFVIIIFDFWIQFIFTFVNKINTMKERIVALMDYFHMTPGQFADRISVQRSSISHILSGRNKPSLEFIQKILRHFPEINTDWLILGKGEIMDKQKTEIREDQKPAEADPEKALPAEKPSIDHIVMCYSDGTFRLYRSGQ